MQTHNPPLELPPEVLLADEDDAFLGAVCEFVEGDLIPENLIVDKHKELLFGHLEEVLEAGTALLVPGYAAGRDVVLAVYAQLRLLLQHEA